MPSKNANKTIHSMKTKIKKSICYSLLIFVCLGFSPSTQALLPPPPPDGGYPGDNTAEGTNALFSLTTGVDNTALGFQALYHNTTGYSNTAEGFHALFTNTGGAQNTATGVNALLFNTTGNSNTANGVGALRFNTTGNNNTANGVQALFSNTFGIHNTATGVQALFSNSYGAANTATGFQALNNNTTGNSNTVIGQNALSNNTAGSFNTAIGLSAGSSITGDGNVCIGDEVPGAAGVNDTTWIRNVYSSVASGRAVYVDSDNKIGTLSSSRRYKDEIRPIARASEAILSLRPVSFRYKKEVDPTRSLSFGLIAEEVAQVDPDLVTPDRAGKPETVRYEAVNAMLLNEFLKEHEKVQELEKQVEKLTAGLQKVSAQLELSKAVPQTALNNH